MEQAKSIKLIKSLSIIFTHALFFAGCAKKLPKPAEEVKAILDWELCTLGDPLADVGYVLNNWVTANELSSMGKGDLSPTAVGGYITRDEFTDIYASRTGRDLSNINYYRAFS